MITKLNSRQLLLLICFKFQFEKKSNNKNSLFLSSNTATLQKKELCAQLFDLEKRFKICYVYVKRKPK